MSENSVVGSVDGLSSHVVNEVSGANMEVDRTPVRGKRGRARQTEIDGRLRVRNEVESGKFVLVNTLEPTEAFVDPTTGFGYVVRAVNEDGTTDALCYGADNRSMTQRGKLNITTGITKEAPYEPVTLPATFQAFRAIAMMGFSVYK